MERTLLAGGKKKKKKNHQLIGRGGKRRWEEILSELFGLEDRCPLEKFANFSGGGRGYLWRPGKTYHELIGQGLRPGGQEKKYHERMGREE